MEDNKPANNEIQIELSEEMAQGTYANLAIISHSSSEFILDFIRVVPGAPKAQVKSRVILTPDNAQRLLFALQDNIKKFGEQLQAQQQAQQQQAQAEQMQQGADALSKLGRVPTGDSTMAGQAVNALGALAGQA